MPPLDPTAHPQAHVTTPQERQVPRVARFVWLGPRFNALGYLSVRSALDRGGLDEVVLHVDRPELERDPLVADLMPRKGFRLSGLDDGGGEGLGEPTMRALNELDKLLDRPASRSNVWRLRILWHLGGLYLDTDAIVLRNLRELCVDPGFAGVERICLPASLDGNCSPVAWGRAGLLLAAREAISRLPNAGAAFRQVEDLYDLACNNAVIGAHPRHPDIGRLLHASAVMRRDKALRRYQLGPRLFEETLGNRSTPRFVLHDPWAFYPLGPEICWDYLRDDPKHRLGDLPDPRAYVAHLYDSVLARRLKVPLDAQYLRRSRGRTMFARMVEPWLDDLLAAQ